MKTKLLILFALISISTLLKSQVTYSVSSIPYTPYSYTVGTTIATPIDDKFTSSLPIGFTFDFFGNYYNNVVISTNGSISFNNSLAGAACPWAFTVGAAIPSSIVPQIRNSILLPFQDTDPSVGSANYISYTTIGVAPYRKFIVNFYNVPMYNCTSLTHTSQAVLHETSNNIDIFIQNKPICSTWNGGRAIEGIQNETGTVAYAVAGRNATVWSATNDAVRFCYNGVCDSNGVSTAFIHGKLYYDINNNCIYDTTDAPAPYQLVTDNSGTSLAMSDANGDYTLYSDTGTRIITIDSSTYFNPQCPNPASYTVVIPTLPDTINNIDFGDTIMPCIHPELSIGTFGLRSCDTNSFLHIYYYNPSPTISYNADLILFLNDSMNIIYCPYPYTLIGIDSYLIDVPDTILAGSYHNFNITVTAGCDSLGTIYSYGASLIGSNYCDSLFVDTDSESTPLRASYDPNEQLVKSYNSAQGFNISNYIDSLTELEYKITFQNSGTANALFVRIVDIISSDLVLNSLRITGSSHPCYMRIHEGIVEFIFDGINLPFGSEIDPTTHGYVTYKIKQKFGHVQGKVIKDKAFIYFDHNPAIITNISNAKIPYICYLNNSATINNPICHNELNGSIIINTVGAHGGSSYFWSNGDTTNEIINLGAGNYNLTVLDNVGCSQILSYTLANPNEVIATLTSDEDTLCIGDIVNLNASGGASYNWSISSSNSSTIAYTINENTNIILTALDNNGCEDDTTMVIYSKECETGFNDIINNIDIYPNPVSDYLNIISRDTKINYIELFSIDGKLLYQTNNFNTSIINMNQFEKGTYVLKLNEGDNIFIKKIIKE